MLTAAIQQQLLQLINKATGKNFKQFQEQRVSGGSINQTFKIEIPQQSFFLKINSAQQYPALFQKEKAGLQSIAATHIIATPEVIADAVFKDCQLLLLTWIESGTKNEKFWETFGEQLARLHMVTNPHFGWKEDNYMACVIQQNKWEEKWTEFFALQRLHPIVRQCIARNLLHPNHERDFEKLYQKLSQLFDEDEKPALLHGDLWSGNFMCNYQEQPVLIDPAVYFGHRAMDLGMTTLFGGFNPRFYQSYHYHFPLPPNYQDQWDITNLYPLLIHLLLFGKSYLAQIEQTVQKFI